MKTLVDGGEEGEGKVGDHSQRLPAPSEEPTLLENAFMEEYSKGLSIPTSTAHQSIPLELNSPTA